ncbi:DUF1819 family protein [Candidatus Bipolaricaulota bacterium]|nr:DUF1819 family protein [Candidatus Bipolaricaulota bacterium]
MFTTRIIKGGALLADSLRFLEAWEPDLSPDENLARFAAQRLLGKTRVREKAVLNILRRRFLETNASVVRTLRRLRHDPVALREACYYEATRTEELLAAFAEEPLFTWYHAGKREITLEDVLHWLATDRRVPDWNEVTRKRVAQGILATFRDFGLLQGEVGSRRKQITFPNLSLRGFLYVSLRERRRCSSDRALLESRVWRRYLLTPYDVRRLFLEANRLGYLHFSEAGSMIRVDWLIESLEEVSNVIPT